MKCSLLTLSCYLDGELEARRSGEMEAHLVACPRCRAGLAHLREEVERVGGLARVSVPESSAQVLFEQLGLVPAGEALPYRRAAMSPAPAEGTSPWLEARPGPALPWTPPPRSPRVAILGPPHDGAAIEVAGLAAPRASAKAPPTAAAVAPTASAPAEVPQLADEAPSGSEAAALSAGAEPAPAHTPVAPAWQPPVARRTDDAAAVPAGGQEIPARPQPIAWSPPPADRASPSDAAAHVPAPPVAGGPTVAVWTTDTLPETAPPLYPLPLGEPEAPEGPVAAPRPRLLERVRDRLALRRTIGTQQAGDDEDEVEVISGTGAPLRARGRTDLARRRSEALRPAAMPSVDIASRAAAGQPRLREMLPPPARPSGSGLATPVARPAPPSRPGVRLGELAPPVAPWRLGDDDEAIRRFSVAAPPAAQERIEPAPSDLRDGRRLLALYAAAAVVLFVVGIVSGRSTSPLPSSAPSTSAPAHQGVAAIPTTAPQSAAPVIPPPSAASAPPRATVTTLGSGGTGWQVQTFRYGAHAGFYRIVIDLAPAAGGAPGPSPTVTVAEQDASTVLVTLQGTQPAASTGTLTNTATISAVTLVPAAGPGETQYRITLTHAGTVHAFFTTTPLRLILDIT